MFGMFPTLTFAYTKIKDNDSDSDSESVKKERNRKDAKITTKIVRARKAELIPKPPRNTFMKFCAEKRAEAAAAGGPKLTAHDLGGMWKMLTPEQKQVYKTHTTA
jgi:hypothetical protein